MTSIAQQKPDFSGEWTLNPRASALSPDVAAALQRGTMRIEHHEPRFRCHFTVIFDGTPTESTYELLTGSEEVTGDEGRRSRCSLRWDGDALVFSFEDESPGGGMTIVFRYELEDGGRRLRAAERLRGGGRDQDNVWVFERP